MSTHTFHEIYLHINWHTENDRPMIYPGLERLIRSLLKQRCMELAGVILLALGMVENHIHVVLKIEPIVCISELIGDLKGFSSHETNAAQGEKMLDWQRGYGVVSFSKSQLSRVISYVENQKEHHKLGTLQVKLEKYSDE